MTPSATFGRTASTIGIGPSRDSGGPLLFKAGFEGKLTGMTNEQQGPAEMVVHLIADPGLPSSRLSAIRDSLEDRLQVLSRLKIQVVTRSELIRLRPDNTLETRVVENLSEGRVDIVILLTEIPRYLDRRPLIAEAYPDERVAVISCPTLGAWATKSKLLRVVTDCAYRLLRDDQVEETYIDDGWGQWISRDDRSSQIMLANPVTGMPRTVLGVMMANQPWRTAPKLSRALAAASATGAFGIFYNSIWQMSEALSFGRLLVISILAVLSMVVWLILSNRLWERPKYDRLSVIVLLYNLSTVTTLLFCVVALYVALWIFILVAGVIVIDPSFMAGVIGGDISILNYMSIAWLSASMGVVAGALGSGFDDQLDLRHITMGARERQRAYTQQE